MTCFMEPIPALDLQNGRCVRLVQGDFAQVTEYSDDPVAVAQEFARAGASRLHLVDLDGAKTGELANWSIISRIAEVVDIPVQVGGGIRSVAMLEHLAASPVERFVIGTMLFIAKQDAKDLAAQLAPFADRIIAALDVKGDEVVVHGWQQGSGITISQAVERLKTLGITRALVTDVGVDGTLEGPSIDLYRHLVAETPLAIIASGGVGTLAHLHALQATGVEGVVIGKALYSGAIDLKDILSLSAQANHLDSIDFAKGNGLIPVIIQEKTTNIVLMLAYMNREALAKTRETGETWFWSRTRQALWHKGGTSGHVQKVHDIFLDCDQDSLLITVEQVGATACHTGEKSCFFQLI